jgi:hypothetical protein
MKTANDAKDDPSSRWAGKLARQIRVDRTAAGELLLDFRDIFQKQLGLSLRMSGAKRRVFASLKGLTDRAWVNDGLVLAVSNMNCSERRLIEESAHALVLPATRPLTPRQVLQVLPINTQERLRWTKDGRMPQSGTVKMRRAHIVSVPTYAVDTIAALVADTSIVERWRARDAETSRQSEHFDLQATG